MMPRIILTTCLLFLFQILAAQSDCDSCPDYRNSMKKGKWHIKKGNFDDALLEFQAAQIAARICKCDDKGKASKKFKEAILGIKTQRDDALSLAEKIKNNQRELEQQQRQLKKSFEFLLPYAQNLQREMMATDSTAERRRIQREIKQIIITGKSFPNLSFSNKITLVRLSHEAQLNKVGWDIFVGIPRGGIDQEIELLQAKQDYFEDKITTAETDRLHRIRIERAEGNTEKIDIAMEWLVIYSDKFKTEIDTAKLYSYEDKILSIIQQSIGYSSEVSHFEIIHKQLSDIPEDSYTSEIQEKHLEVINILIQQSEGVAQFDYLADRAQLYEQQGLEAEVKADYARIYAGLEKALENEDGTANTLSKHLLQSQEYGGIGREIYYGSSSEFTMPKDSLFPYQWYLHSSDVEEFNTLSDKWANANVLNAWKALGNKGSHNITIAIVDNGFDLSHPDLADNIYKPWDLWNNSSNIIQGDPSFTHGTPVAGLVLARENGYGIVGVAPNSKFMPISGTSYSLLATEQMFRHATENDADVMICSWGTTDSRFDLNSAKKDVISIAAKEGRDGKGLVIVFPVGNEGLDYVSFYAAHPDVIAVGSSTTLDQHAPFSNQGMELDLVVPTEGDWPLVTIKASWDKGRLNQKTLAPPQYQIGGKPLGSSNKHFAGTSVSSAIVGGICALVLSANPELTAKEVKEILIRTADKIGNPNEYDKNGHSKKYGYGRVNAERAVLEALRGNQALQYYRDAKSLIDQYTAKHSAYPSKTTLDSLGVSELIEKAFEKDPYNQNILYLANRCGLTDEKVFDNLIELPKDHKPRYMWCLDNGHGKFTAGKRSPKFDDGSRFHEYEFNRDIVRRVKEKLDVLGLKYYVVVPEIDTDNFLSGRVDRANAYETDLPKLFVSIHSNAGLTKSNDQWAADMYRGVETYYFTGNTQGKTMASIFQKQLVDYTEMLDRKIKHSDRLYVLKNTNMPAIMTENGFYNNKEEGKKLMTDEFRQKIADAHVAAILQVEILGLDKLPLND